MKEHRKAKKTVTVEEQDETLYSMAEVKWVRKASEIEVAYHKEGQSGNYLAVYRISFCARRPVQPQQVEVALRLLYR